MTPQIGLVCFAIILVSWFGGVKYPQGHSGRPGRDRGRHAHRLGLEPVRPRLGGMSVKGLGDAFANFGFSVPMPAFGQVFSGFEFLGVILVTAIPFGIYDLVEAMDNVESAEAAGDDYPTTRVLTADGVVSLIGCLMGNPFINAVYIGHPGWKAMGGRIGYSAATGVMVIVLSWFGIISVMLALIPVVAISPILLYIGMLIGAQAFQNTPQACAGDRAGADAASAAWAKLLIDTMLARPWRLRRRSAGLAATRSARSRRRDRVAAAAGRALSRARSDGRRLDPRRPHPRRDRRLRHRARTSRRPRPSRWPAPCSLISASCMARRSGSAAGWRHAGGGAGLCGGGGGIVRAQQARCRRALCSHPEMSAAPAE